MSQLHDGPFLLLIIILKLMHLFSYLSFQAYQLQNQLTLPSFLVLIKKINKKKIKKNET